MARKREGENNRQEVKWLRELKAELKTIIAWYKGEPHDPAEFDPACARVYDALLREARSILRPVFDSLTTELAENARALCWMSMHRGGFARYDGRSGTIAAYVCGALRKICSGRENLGQVLGRRRTRREPDDEQHNQSGNSPGKREPDRRQVPLEFPPIDPNSSGEIERRDRADFAQAMLNELSPGDRELFIRHHMHDENVSALARKLGTTRRALDMRLHRAKEKLRERFKGFQW